MSTLNDYEILDKIGSGTYGEVFKAQFKRQDISTEVRKLIVSHLSFFFFFWYEEFIRTAF